MIQRIDGEWKDTEEIIKLQNCFKRHNWSNLVYKYNGKLLHPKINANYYTIQVAAKKDKKSADKFMKEMQGNEFDAYIQEYYKEKSKELWYACHHGSESLRSDIFS